MKNKFFLVLFLFNGFLLQAETPVFPGDEEEDTDVDLDELVQDLWAANGNQVFVFNPVQAMPPLPLPDLQALNAVRQDVGEEEIGLPLRIRTRRPREEFGDDARRVRRNLEPDFEFIARAEVNPLQMIPVLVQGFTQALAQPEHQGGSPRF